MKTNLQVNSQRKKLIIGVGLAALVVIVAVTMINRGAQLGSNNNLFQDTSVKETQKLSQGDEFFIDVEYTKPFTTDRTLVEERQNTAASIYAGNSFFDGIKQFFNSIPKNSTYQAVAAEFTTIESLNDNSLLYLTPETMVNDSADNRALGYTGQRKIIIDDEGNVSLVYRKRFGDDYQIFLSQLQKIEGKKYLLMSPKQPLSVRTLGITQRVPSITMDEKGLTHVVWYGSDDDKYENRRQIFHTQSKNSLSFWEENEVVSYVEGYSSEYDQWQEHPSITLGEYDDLFVVWEGKDKSNEKPQVKFSRSLDGGGSWSSWSNIHPSDNFTYSRPTLVYTESNNTLHLFAYSSEDVESETNQIKYSTSKNLGISWSPWETISEGNFDSRHISATVINDIPVIAYRAQTTQAGPTQILVQQITNENPAPALIHQSDDYQFFPSITGLKGTSEYCVTWIQENTPSSFPNEDPSDGDIYFACNDILSNDSPVVYNLTPRGSHLYPVLPLFSTREEIPIAYYDDESESIVLRMLTLGAPS